MVTSATTLTMYGIIFGILHAAPVSLTVACYAEVVPISILSDALSVTTLLEAIGVFGSPLLAGKIADETNMASPMYLGGSLIIIGGILNITANFVNKNKST